MRTLRAQTYKALTLALMAFILLSVWDAEKPGFVRLAPARVQFASNENDTGATRVAVTWGSATTAGNLLIAGVGTNGNPGTITPPAGGWTSYGTDSNTTPFLTCYHIDNAASQSGAKTWTMQNAVNVLCVIVAEYSGIATSSPLDQGGTANHGSSITPTTATTGTTSQASEEGIAFVCQAGNTGGINPIFSSATNGYTIATSQAGNDGTNACTLGLLDITLSSTGTTSTGCTSTRNTTWATVIATFKAPGSSPKLLPILGVG